jgi:hypothetical protein
MKECEEEEGFWILDYSDDESRAFKIELQA